MARKNSTSALAMLGAYHDRSIIFDRKGVPWWVDPEKGTIQLATIIMPKQSAVVPPKKKK
jgi:hypothetical protein